jgi:hypothetical protein
MDPRDPASKRRVAEVKGGGWGIAAIAPGNRTAIVAEYRSVTDVNLYRLDLASGKLTRSAITSEDHRLWRRRLRPRRHLVGDLGRGQRRPAPRPPRPATGRFTPVSPQSRWDVESFAIAKDGRTIAFVTNEAGVDRLSLLDVASGRIRRVDSIPAGTIGGLEFAPVGRARPVAQFGQEPDRRLFARPEVAQAHPLDPERDRRPRSQRQRRARAGRVKSFDGEPVSGFLYRPDPAQIPRQAPADRQHPRRPRGPVAPGLHGPQQLPPQRAGIAIFFPNVRGSTGYGKRFVGLDNGAFKREDSVKDIGAFLDILAADPASTPAASRSPAAPTAATCATPRRSLIPTRFKGALCNVAISNFVTFLEGTQSYRRDLRRVEYGDERDPKQRAKLQDISPLRRIAEIKAPCSSSRAPTTRACPRPRPTRSSRRSATRGGTAWYLSARMKATASPRRKTRTICSGTR